MSTIEFTLPLFSLQSPYQQLMTIINNGGKLIGTISASTVPNYQVPNAPDRPNLDEYPIICGGMYSGVFKGTGHNLTYPAIVLEDNGNIPIYQGGNPRFPSQGKNATFIHIHEGGESWRGSAGCLTMAPGGSKFISHIFAEDEPVLVIIPDPFWFAFEGK